MATSNNPFFVGFSGSFGDTFTVKNYSGKAVVCRKIGERKKKATPAQKNNEWLFRAANAMAKKIYADPIQREEARLRLKMPHGSALYRAILKECREKVN